MEFFLTLLHKRHRFASARIDWEAAHLFPEGGGRSMKVEKPFAALETVWRRVEELRPRAQGSARLMPRREQAARTIRFAPPRW